MYDPATGRVFDGINGPVSWRVNRNSGAESTIEGLMSLQAVADIPQAAKYLQVQPVSGNNWQIVQAEDGERLNGEPTYYTASWTGETVVSGGRYVGLKAGQAMQVTFNVEHGD